MVSLALIELILLWLIGVHEFGHVAVARILGLRAEFGIKHWSIPVARVQVDEGWQNFMVAAGGPLLSTLVGVLLIHTGFATAGYLSLLFALTALIPFKHNDGWRMIMPTRGLA